MTAARRFSAIIEREDDGYVALCPELDIASEGASIEESREHNRSVDAVFLRVRRRRKSPGGHESRNDVKQSPDNTYSHARVT